MNKYKKQKSLVNVRKLKRRETNYVYDSNMLMYYDFVSLSLSCPLKIGSICLREMLLIRWTKDLLGSALVKTSASCGPVEM